MRKPQRTGSRTRRQKAKQAKRQRRRKPRSRRRPLQVRRAKVDPKPAPRARSYFIQRIWDKLGLDDALERVGITKDGLPFSTLFIIVLLMGAVGASSLNGLTTLLPHDAALCTMLAISVLDEKQLYRGLGSISIAQYQAWMGYLLGALQADPRTASRPDGVVAGDTTQVAKPDAHKIPGVHVLFLHSEKRFVKGAEILSTHYADLDKDYPLFMAFYEPDEATRKQRAEEKARRQAGVDGRKPGEVLAYIEQQVNQGNAPELVILSGPRLNRKLTQGLDRLDVPWLGVSDGRRKYHLTGRRTSQKAKALLSKARVRRWQTDPDLGYRFGVLGTAQSSVGEVLLIVAEHMADGVRTLYLVPADTEEAEAIARITEVLSREQQQREGSLLNQMLTLLRLSREAGIRAETATFDRWSFVPWFICAVLQLGFQRVVIKAKAGFKYTYQGQDYDLAELWSQLSESDFKDYKHKGITYKLASLVVELKGVGRVKLVFVRQPTRRSKRLLESVLMCTDINHANERVLLAYLLRWRIEVCYREVKQNHAFGAFHSQTFETNYGQTMLSLVAYLFMSLLRWLVSALGDCSLGWIKEHYLNAIVRLVETDGPDGPRYVLEFPGWLMDDYGLPPWDTFCVPPPAPIPIALSQGPAPGLAGTQHFNSC